MEGLGLHYTKDRASEFIGYADAGFKSDENFWKSQSEYIFCKNNALISWKSMKQTVTTTSTNHLELIVFHKAMSEAMWLRTMHMIIT